jgi:hypothetical protein
VSAYTGGWSDAADAKLVSDISNPTTPVGAAVAGAAGVAALPTDGTTDIGPALQAFYDAGGRVLNLQRNSTYLLNTPVFLDQNSPLGGLVINGNKATIKLGSGLPTTNWSSSTTCKFGVFVNVNRSALSGGVVTMSNSTRPTGINAGALRSLIVRDLVLDGQATETGFSYADRTGATFENCVGYRIRVVHTWRDYPDANSFVNCYSRTATTTTPNQVFFEQVTNGDGITVVSPKADATIAFSRQKTCRGAVISGMVSGRMDFEQCTGIVIEGAHLEGQASLNTMLYLKHSHVVVNGGIFYDAWGVSTPPVVIDDVTQTETGSELVLNQCVSQKFFSGSETANVEFSSMIHIAAAQGNTRIIANDLKGTVTSLGIGGLWPDSSQPRITAADANITAAITSARGRAALARGTFNLHRNATGSWVLDTIAPQVYSSIRQSAAPALSQITANTGMTGGGTLTSGTVYAYAVAVMDALGNYSAASTEVTATADGNLSTRLLVTVSDPPAVLVVWRKTATGVLSAPDRYAVIPVRSPRSYLYDTGGYISGIPWVTTSVPVPTTVAGTNNTLAALVLNGVQITS